jgi:hypothetical protein
LNDKMLNDKMSSNDKMSLNDKMSSNDKMLVYAPA